MNLDHSKVRRESMRWYILLTLNNARPNDTNENLVLQTVQGIFPDATALEVRKELDYLSNRLLVEVKKEPMMALDGGMDGLDFYRRLLTQAEKHLLPNGFLLMEVGIHQAQPVTEIAETLGWKTLEKPICDYGGIERVVLFSR